MIIVVDCWGWGGQKSVEEMKESSIEVLVEWW